MFVSVVCSHLRSCPQVGKGQGCSKPCVWLTYSGLCTAFSVSHHWFLLPAGCRVGDVPLSSYRPRLLACLCHWAKATVPVTNHKDASSLLYLGLKLAFSSLGVPAPTSQQNSPQSASQLSAVYCDWIGLPSFQSVLLALFCYWGLPWVLWNKVRVLSTYFCSVYQNTALLYLTHQLLGLLDPLGKVPWWTRLLCSDYLWVFNRAYFVCFKCFYSFWLLSNFAGQHD